MFTDGEKTFEILMAFVIVGFACIILASCQSVAPAGKYERSDHREIRREIRDIKDICPDCGEPGHPLPTPR